MVKDDKTTNISKYFDYSIKWIENKLLENNGNILIHC